MDHHSSVRFGCILAACRTCPGADAANTSGNAQPAAGQVRAAENRRSVALKYQFRLGDGEIDLLKAFSLDGSDGVGSAWKVPSVGKWSASGIGNGTAASSLSTAEVPLYNLMETLASLLTFQLALLAILVMGYFPGRTARGSVFPRKVACRSHYGLLHYTVQGHQHARGQR
jgi:hypothetical protein